ncbi:MAG: glutamate synthase-related protein [Nocardioidaceae bacterium]
MTARPAQPARPVRDGDIRRTLRQVKTWWKTVPAAALAAVAAHDLLQRKHAILRNFPVVGHARFWLESIGPELRQYIVAGNDEERPFSRDQRRWVYASAKQENNYFGFGTDNDLEHGLGNVIVHHRTFGRTHATHGHPAQEAWLPCAKVLGGAHRRKLAFRPDIRREHLRDELRFAVGQRRRGAQPRCEARGLSRRTPARVPSSRYHRMGGELIFQIGTAYFGCRDEHGRFSLDHLLEVVANAPIRALEVKLSQGAKPGLGGVLPAAKVSA